MKLDNLKSDPILIKNPFICNSIRSVRLSLEKDPKALQGNTQLCHKVELENGNTYLHNPTDEKLSFMIGKNDIRDELKEMVDIKKYDYQIPAEELNKKSKVKHKEGLPLSFLQIDNEEEGLEWYANNYPKIPTDLLPIIARYHWGDPITKKGLKKEKKKIIKKVEKKGLSVMTQEENNNNPFFVKFD